MAKRAYVAKLMAVPRTTQACEQAHGHPPSDVRIVVLDPVILLALSG
jgi:hypothetical protein